MILLVDKPTWWTSHDVVKYVKIHRWYKQVWHAGTLDPLATGLLMLLTDKDTKKMADIVWHDKTYTATIDLSHISDTWDKDYHDMYEEVPPPAVMPTYEQVQAAFATMTPKASLMLPSFSAKKIWWRRMYKSARQGVVHEIQKDMDIYSIEITDYSFPYISIRCHVGSGTFIRSIAHHIGVLLGTWWIIEQLRRESVWEFSVTDPTCIKDLSALQQNNMPSNT